MASVSYRKVGDRWHIRMREHGRKEIIKSFPGSMQERTIRGKTEWYSEEIALGRYDPWEEQRNEKKTISFTISEAVDNYIRWGKATERWKVHADGTCHTADTNERRLGDMAESIDLLDKVAITDWLVRKDVGAVTKRSYKTTINTFLRWMYDQGHTPHLIQIDLPKQIKDQANQKIQTPKGISHEQLLEFCTAAKKRTQALEKNKHYHRSQTMGWIIPAAQLLFWQMLRKGELLHLYPEDFSQGLDYLTIGHSGSKDRDRFIPKGGIETMPILDPAKQVIHNFGLADMPKGKPIFDYASNYINIAFRRISQDAFGDVIFSPHTFRHGGIIYLRSVIKEPGLVTELARHSSQEVTERIYGGIDPVYLKRAVDRSGLSGIQTIAK